MNRLTRKLLRMIDPHARISYAQMGEDLILREVLNELRIDRPTYLEIGANHPFLLSNTYLFYRGGSRGVLVEPNPTLIPALRAGRPGDVCLNVGVGIDARMEADFYVLTDSVMSTFSKEEADRLVAAGKQKLIQILKMPLLSVEQIVQQYMNGRWPDLISMDTEGFDLAILQSMDFAKTRTPVLCVETQSSCDAGGYRKVTAIIDLMRQANYGVYADTRVNTIFVDRAVMPGSLS